MAESDDKQALVKNGVKNLWLDKRYSRLAVKKTGTSEFVNLFQTVSYHPTREWHDVTDIMDVLHKFSQIFHKQRVLQGFWTMIKQEEQLPQC